MVPSFDKTVNYKLQLILTRTLYHNIRCGSSVSMPLTARQLCELFHTWCGNSAVLLTVNTLEYHLCLFVISIYMQCI